MAISLPLGLTPGQILTATREGGLTLEVYPDPLTGGSPWTGAYGITGPLITKPGIVVASGLTLLPDEWTAEYRARYERDGTQAAVDIGTSYWSDLDAVRQAVFCDVAHQTGGAGLASFHLMLAASRVNNWTEASRQLRASKLALQTPDRCNENADMLETGLWPSWLKIPATPF